MENVTSNFIVTKGLILILIFTASISRGQTFSFDSINLSAGQTHICWELYFEIGQGTLLYEPSKPTLDSIVKFLILHPSVKIEIGQHTDKRGQEKFNMKLTQERADAIKTYLVNSGIDTGRITCKGYGSSRPYLTPEQEIANKRTSHPPNFPRNRRTTITILSK